MALGTLDRRPPPLFRQGPTALNKLLFCAALGVLLMVADARLGLTGPLRTALATVLAPVQQVLLTPVAAFENLTARLRGADSAMRAEALARSQLAAQALTLARARSLAEENEHLRQLLGLRARLPVATTAAELLFESGDLYARRVVLDRGSADGLRAGAPVIDERGVLGQLQRVHRHSAELVLLADRSAVIPVQNERTGAPFVAAGGERSAGLELRFVPANADLQPGDVLRTSGLDGVYPPGLPVARVERVERRGGSSSFATVSARPFAVAGGARQVLVLGALNGVAEAREEAGSVPASAAGASR